MVSMIEFAGALTKLPAAWAGLPREEVSVTEYRGMLILVNVALNPIVYQEGAWVQLQVNKQEGVIIHPPEHTVDPDIQARRDASKARVGQPIIMPKDEV